MAQSVLSHTGGDMLDRPLQQAAKVLAPGGQFLFTILDESTQAWNRLKRGNDAPGWHYPVCVTYECADIQQRCEAAGLKAQAIDWFHPRQHWYRAVKSDDFLLDADQLARLDAGKPMFDDRFD